jgi:A/G-specific adenine glycosylase
VAFGQAEPLLDGNVKRVLSRLADVAEPVDATPTVKHLWALARDLVEAAPAAPGMDSDAGVLMLSLIELGEVVCVPSRPRCLLCPVEELCRARRNGTQEQRPIVAARKQTPHYDVAAGVIWQGEPFRSPVLIAQRPHAGLLGGLWEFPGGKREESDADLRATLVREIAEELGIAIKVGAQAAEVKHAFSHFRITLHAFHARHTGGEPQAIGCADWRWVALEELDAFAMGVADRRVLAALRAAQTGAADNDPVSRA